MRIVALSFLMLLVSPVQAQTRANDPSAELDRATEWLRRNNNENALATERSLVLDAGRDSGTTALERHGDRIDRDRRIAESEQRAREAARAEALRRRGR
jgi:hypothetical protein